MLVKKLTRPAGKLLIAGLIGGLVPSFDAESLLRRVAGDALPSREVIELQPLPAPQALDWRPWCHVPLRQESLQQPVRSSLELLHLCQQSRRGG